MIRSPIRLLGSLALLVAAVPRVSAAPAGSSSNTPTIEAVADSGEARGIRPTAVLEERAQAAGLDVDLLVRAMEARQHVLDSGKTASSLLTVIDFSKPSREPRLWVIDLEADSVLARELVAHGNKSGGDLATSFSNRVGSNQSSLGTYLTGATYMGKHGLSLRLHGLDAGLNDAAYQRAVVVHGAAYVSPSVIPQLGRLGRSQGCPALTQESAPRIINLIKDGSVIYAWHPQLTNAT